MTDINRTSWKGVFVEMATHMSEEQLHNVIAHCWARIADFDSGRDKPNDEFERAVLLQTIDAVTAYLVKINRG